METVGAKEVEVEEIYFLVGFTMDGGWTEPTTSSIGVLSGVFTGFVLV